MAYVDTISEFIQRLIHEKGDGYEVYGLGAADSRPVKYIVEKLKLLLNSGSILEGVTRDSRNTCHQIDISKALAAGYKALSVDETLERFARDAKQAGKETIGRSRNQELLEWFDGCLCNETKAFDPC